MHNPKHQITVGLVGKYVDLPDAYLSVSEALRAGGFANDAKVNLKWIASDECESEAGARAMLSDVDAICVPGGFGIRGIEGKLGALKFARENKIPTLGLCLGLQCMVIEAARNLGGIPDANSAEFDPESGTHVIATMASQKEIVEGEGDMGGTMRLGLYQAELVPGSIVATVYGATSISERHRHRYEVNNKYRDQIASAGLVFLESTSKRTSWSLLNYLKRYILITWEHRRIQNFAHVLPKLIRYSPAWWQRPLLERISFQLRISNADWHT